MLTEKLDIYSMGNIFWAMLGRDVPFIRDDTYKGKVLRGERPKVDPLWHKEFVEVRWGWVGQGCLVVRKGGREERKPLWPPRPFGMFEPRARARVCMESA